MSRKKLSRNAPCPCGSGKKYKHCCWGRGAGNGSDRCFDGASALAKRQWTRVYSLA